MRKTNNLLIRESSKKVNPPQVGPGQGGISKPLQPKDKKQTQEQLELQKEMIKAETLSTQEQQQIQGEAKKAANRKSKLT